MSLAGSVLTMDGYRRRTVRTHTSRSVFDILIPSSLLNRWEVKQKKTMDEGQ